MRCRIALIAVLLAALAGCSREQAPDLPPVDQTKYQEDHQVWRAEQREMLRSVLPIRGIWPLPEGRTEANKLAGGSVELVETSIGDDRQFVAAIDRSHPAATNPPDVESLSARRALARTVLDFDFATNPPCAYSPYTACPLPPPENKLPVAIEAGLKRLPSANGYTPAS